MGLITMPFVSDRALASIESLQQKPGVVNSPAVDGSMVSGDASLGPRLLESSEITTRG
jgi:hypothetical protein